jgi:hypothetical protein
MIKILRYEPESFGQWPPEGFYDFMILHVFKFWDTWYFEKAGLSIFFKCASTSLFTGCTFSWAFFHEYLVQHSLKSGGTKDHFRSLKVPGTVPYWKACKSVFLWWQF